MTTAWTEQTPTGLATYSEPTFRTYPPFWVENAERGVWLQMQLCETFEDGRWEPFATTLARSDHDPR